MTQILIQISALEYQSALRILGPSKSGVRHITIHQNYTPGRILDTFFLTISAKTDRPEQTTQQETPGEIHKVDSTKNRNR